MTSDSASLRPHRTVREKVRTWIRAQLPTRLQLTNMLRTSLGLCVAIIFPLVPTLAILYAPGGNFVPVLAIDPLAPGPVGLKLLECVLRILGTVVGAYMGIAYVTISENQGWALVLCVFVTILIAYFIRARYPILAGGFGFVIVGVIVSFTLAFSNPSFSRLTVAGKFSLLVTTAEGIGLVMNLFFFPTFTHRALLAGLIRLNKLSSDILRFTRDASKSTDSDEVRTAKALDLLRTANAAITAIPDVVWPAKFEFLLVPYTFSEVKYILDLLQTQLRALCGFLDWNNLYLELPVSDPRRAYFFAIHQEMCSQLENHIELTAQLLAQRRIFRPRVRDPVQLMKLKETILSQLSESPELLEYDIQSCCSEIIVMIKSDPTVVDLERLFCFGKYSKSLCQGYFTSRNLVLYLAELMSSPSESFWFRVFHPIACLSVQRVKSEAFKSNETQKFTLSYRLWKWGKAVSGIEAAYAFRAALAAILISLPILVGPLVTTLRTWNWSWTVLTVLFMLRPFIGETALGVSFRMMGAAVGMGVSAAVISIFPSQPVYTGIVTGVVIFIQDYFRYCTRFSTLSVTAMATYFLISLTFYSSFGVNNPYTVLWIRSVDVFIGTAFGGVATFFLPYSARRTLRRGIGEVLTTVNEHWKLLVERYTMPTMTTAGHYEIIRKLEEIDDRQIRKLKSVALFSIHEFRLKGPFPFELYDEVLMALQDMINALHAMRIHSNGIYSMPFHRTVVLPLNRTFSDFYLSLDLAFTTVADSFHLNKPLPMVFPSPCTNLDLIYRDILVVARANSDVLIQDVSSIMLFGCLINYLRDLSTAVEDLAHAASLLFGQEHSRTLLARFIRSSSQKQQGDVESLEGAYETVPIDAGLGGPS